MRQRAFGSSAKTIQKASTLLMEESQKNAFAGVLQRRFYFIVCDYQLRTLVQSRSA